MLVYSEKITPRLQYISRLILHELLGINFQILSSRDSFINDTVPKLNYSSANIPDSAWIKPAGLLFETGIREQDIYAPVWKNKTVFFITGSEPDIPYDPFSAAFYMVTRYEEYLPHDVDEHGRYDPRDSIAYQNDFLRSSGSKLLGSGAWGVIKNQVSTVKIEKEIIQRNINH